MAKNYRSMKPEEQRRFEQNAPSGTQIGNAIKIGDNTFTQNYGNIPRGLLASPEQASPPPTFNDFKKNDTIINNNMANISQARSFTDVAPVGVSSSPLQSNDPMSVSYGALSQEQKSQAGDFSQFQTLVQQQQAKGLNEDVSIGNVIGSLGKQPTPSIITSEGADVWADGAYKDMKDVGGLPLTPTVKPLVSDEAIAGITSQMDSEYNDLISKIDEVRATSSGREIEELDGIAEKYGSMQQQVALYNANRMKALEIMGGRAGRQRFAQEIQSGIMSGEASAGLERITALNRSETEERLAVIKAYEDKDFNLMLMRFNTMKELRQEKSEEIDKLYQRAMMEENLILAKSAETRAWQQYNLSVDQFNEQAKQNKWDNAFKVAQESGYKMKMDQDGNISILPELTFDNKLRLDVFEFESAMAMSDLGIRHQQLLDSGEMQKAQIEQMAHNQVIDLANLELAQDGFQLNRDKFHEDTRRFGLGYALDQAQMDLARQVGERQQTEHMASLMQMGIVSPYEAFGIMPHDQYIREEIGGVISSIDTNIIGSSGVLRPDGWECGEFARRIVNLGTPDNLTGNLVSEKLENVKRYGLTIDEVERSGGFQIGDVLITNGADVSRTRGITDYGHAAVVVGFDQGGNLILHEANRTGNGQITTGRKLSPDNSAILGVLGRKNAKSVGDVGLKNEFYKSAVSLASKNVGNKIDSHMTKETADEIIEFNKNIRSQPAYKDVRSVADSWQKIVSGLEAGTGVGDITAMMAFAKLNNPGAVVRVQTQELIKDGNGFLQKFWNSDESTVSAAFYQGKLESGRFFAPGTAQEMLDISQRIHNEMVQQFNTIEHGEFYNLAQARNLPMEFIASEFIKDPRSIKVDLGSGALDIFGDFNVPQYSDEYDYAYEYEQEINEMLKKANFIPDEQKKKFRTDYQYMPGIIGKIKFDLE